MSQVCVVQTKHKDAKCWWEVQEPLRASSQLTERSDHCPTLDAYPRDIKAHIHETANEEMDVGSPPQSQPAFKNCLSMS